MELLRGETLKARLQRVGRFGLGEARPIVAQMVAGMAHAHAAGEELSDAVSEFQLLLQGAPENDAVRYYLATAYEKLGRNAQAREHLEAIRPSSDVYVDAVVYLAFLDEKDDKVEAALARLKAALESHPEEIRLARTVGDLLRRDKRTDEAIQYLEEAVRHSPKSPDLYFALGVAYDQKKDLNKTIANMEKVLELDPDNAHALNYIGYTWADRDTKLAEAEKMVRRALELQPGDGYITDSLGWVFYRQGKLTEALQTLEEAVRLAPQDPQIAAHLAELYEKTGYPERALSTYEQALTLLQGQDPKDSVDGNEKLRKDIEARIKELRKKLKRT